MNYFFAVEPSSEVRDVLADYSKRWRSLLGEERFRWYEPSDYHITLKFLGNLQPADEKRLIAAAWPVSEQTGSFSVELAGPSAWPNPQRFANVLINGIYSSDGLTSLMSRLEQALSREGFQEEKRPYLPHVTFARCKKREQNISFAAFEHAFLKFTVHHFVLMQTLPPEQRANGAKGRYNIVHTFPFGNAHS